MTSNCPLPHRVKSLGKQEAVNCGGGDKHTVYVSTSSPSQLFARGFCTMGSQRLVGVPEAPLAHLGLQFITGTCQCGTPVGFVPGRPGGQFGLCHSALEKI